MNKIITLVGILALASLAITFFKRQPSLPAVLAKIECQQNSKHLSSNEYDVVLVAKTEIAVPCTERASLSNLERDWERTKKASPLEKVGYNGVFFKKAPGGGFKKTDDATTYIPSPVVAQYTVRTTFSPLGSEKPGDWGNNRWELTLPTPMAFIANGPNTTFMCKGPQRPGASYPYNAECLAYVRSNNLQWDILVSFSDPARKDLDLEVEVAEAYELIAAHVISQK